MRDLRPRLTWMTIFTAACFWILATCRGQCPVSTFTPTDPGNGTWFDNTNGLVVWDPDGAGSAPAQLIVVGDMTSVGGIPVSTVASWTGSTWQAFGSGLTGTGYCGAVYNGQLIVGGTLTISGSPSNLVAAWNGTSWTSMSLFGFASPVNALAVYNGALVAGGSGGMFGIPGCITRWNGSTWQGLGGGFASIGVPGVNDLTIYNGELIACGGFTTAGGVPCNGIARWNGATWAPLGSGVSSNPDQMCVYDGQLYVKGNISNAGGVPVSGGLARWDGAAWHSCGTFGGGTTWAIGTHAGDLVAVGTFTSIDGVQCNHIARWHGCWRSWGNAVIPAVPWELGGMMSFDDALFVAGKYQIGPPFPAYSVVVRYRDPLAISQPGGPGTGLMIRNSGLLPGHEYFNLASFDLCPGCLGSGPYGGLCSTDLTFLLYELSFPVGSHPFHFIATGTDLLVGPYVAPIGVPFEAITADVTNPGSICIAPPIRFTLQ